MRMQAWRTLRVMLALFGNAVNIIPFVSSACVCYVSKTMFCIYVVSCITWQLSITFCYSVGLQMYMSVLFAHDATNKMCSLLTTYTYPEDEVKYDEQQLGTFGTTADSHCQ